MAVRIDEAAPELARALRAVHRVTAAARTKEQKAAASRMTDRWTALAVQAGWSRQQIAEAADVRLGAITDRARRQRLTRGAVPPLFGVLAVPGRTVERADAGAVEAPAADWPGRGGPVGQLSAGLGQLLGGLSRCALRVDTGRAKRLYDRLTILRAADKRPTEKHPGWQRSKNVSVPQQLRTEPGTPLTCPLNSS